MGRVNQAPALINLLIIQQMLHRSRRKCCAAILDLFDLFRDVDMDRSIARQGQDFGDIGD